MKTIDLTKFPKANYNSTTLQNRLEEFLKAHLPVEALHPVHEVLNAIKARAIEETIDSITTRAEHIKRSQAHLSE